MRNNGSSLLRKMSGGWLPSNGISFTSYVPYVWLLFCRRQSTILCWPIEPKIGMAAHIVAYLTSERMSMADLSTAAGPARSTTTLTPP